jgi:hypothetical protein
MSRRALRQNSCIDRGKEVLRVEAIVDENLSAPAPKILPLPLHKEELLIVHFKFIHVHSRAKSGWSDELLHHVPM